MPSFDEDDLKIHSEVIWHFNDVNKQLLNEFQSGKSYTEELETIGGYKWKIELYPNGKDKINYFSVLVTLVKTGDDHNKVDAECFYTLVNKDKHKNYAGDIKRKDFKLNESGEDSRFL